MVTIILIVLLVLVVLGFCFVVYTLDQRMKELKENAGTALLKQDLISLTDGVAQLKDGKNSQQYTERKTTKPH